MKIKEIKFAITTVMYKLRHNPIYIIEYFKKIYYLLTYDYEMIKDKYKNIQMISNDETLDEIIKKGKSIVRYGDGELEMIMGCSNYSGRYKEKYSKRLAKYLKDALMDYNNPNMIITIPYCRLIEDHNKSIFWYYSQYNFYKFFSNEYKYGDAFIFRDLDKKQISRFFNYLKDKDVLYISHKKNIELIKNKLNANSVAFYEAVINESFSQYDDIKHACELFIKVKKDPIILISSGKTSKALVYDLSEKVQVIDMGAFIEANTNR